MNNIKIMRNELKMRRGVGIILIKDDGLVWTGKRKNGPGVRVGERNLWQMPQGGIDDGEEPLKAAYRELEEETGTKSAEILFEHESWFEYELPNELIGKVKDSLTNTYYNLLNIRYSHFQKLSLDLRYYQPILFNSKFKPID